MNNNVDNRRLWPLEGTVRLLWRTCCLRVVVPLLLTCHGDYYRQVNLLTHCATQLQARWIECDQAIKKVSISKIINETHEIINN